MEKAWTIAQSYATNTKQPDQEKEEAPKPAQEEHPSQHSSVAATDSAKDTVSRLYRSRILNPAQLINAASLLNRSRLLNPAPLLSPTSRLYRSRILNPAQLINAAYC